MSRKPRLRAGDGEVCQFGLSRRDALKLAAFLAWGGVGAALAADADARPALSAEPGAVTVLDRSPHRDGALGRRALNEALKNLGTRENPPGSNKTPYGKWIGLDGVPWNNTFVSYCFAVGANYVICSGFRGPGVYPRGCVYTPTTLAWLGASGMWKGVTTPMPGDIAIYDFGAGVPVHIGIVEEYLGRRHFNAIEGNTNLGNETSGGGVGRRARSLKDVLGFGRVVR